MSGLNKIVATLLLAGGIGWLAINASSSAAGESIKLTWSVETGAPINLPPLVVANQVLVNPKDGPLISFDVSSGRKKWQYAPPRGVWSRGTASDGQRIFVCLKGAELAALNAADGSELWKTDLGINCQRPALVYGDSIYVSTTFVGTGLPSNTFSGAKLFSINPADGAINWSFTSDNYILQTPFGFGDTVYLGGNYRNVDATVDEGGFNRFYALDNKTGKVKWTFESEHGFPKALYATKDRLVFVGYQDYLVAIDTSNGKQAWIRATANWVPSLSGVGELVYYGAANTDVLAWEMSSGKTRWQYNIPGGAFNYLMGKPVFADNTMYFKSHKGEVFALDRHDGMVLWSQQTDIETRTGLSVSGDNLFIGATSGTLYAYKILK